MRRANDDRRPPPSAVKRSASVACPSPIANSLEPDRREEREAGSLNLEPGGPNGPGVWSLESGPRGLNRESEGGSRKPGAAWSPKPPEARSPEPEIAKARDA